MTRTSSQKDSLLTFALQHLDGINVSRRNAQRAIPALAKNPDAVKAIAAASRQLPTKHMMVRGDARRMEQVGDGSVHLALTSPPYWTLKPYRQTEGQLGHVHHYEEFLGALDKVWKECYRVLVPGGRLIVVVGDVCQSRKEHGRHSVVPLHASIQEHCRKLGFDNLAPIIWYKIANAKYEVENGSRFLGKPYEPNAVVKNDIEYILMQRKPGGYRKPSLGMRLLSVIPEADQKEWFQQIWTLPGASTRDHPAPFPITLAERLIRMFSFVGDTVLDPFLGSGTTTLAASRWGRNSIGYEIDEEYFKRAKSRLDEHMVDLLSGARLEAVDVLEPSLLKA
ncbi:MAG TPA: site-specific DNA-methyltransferase [Candidatus Xenobia bacterium]|nr:site-specific DNA-methyltransferase [Candidatus Xenobia bacterium]